MDAKCTIRVFVRKQNHTNRTRIPTEAPVLRLPATQAASEPEPEARDTRRQGGR